MPASAANGNRGARLAATGMNGWHLNAFEAPSGLFERIVDHSDADRTSPADRLKKRRVCLETRLVIKRYPIWLLPCHRSLMACWPWCNHQLKPSDVKHIEVTIGPAHASMLRNHQPQTELDAKFQHRSAMARRWCKEKWDCVSSKMIFVQKLR